MSDDLINKKEALNLLRKRSQQLVGIYGDLGGAVSGAAKLIDELPTADRPQDEWHNKFYEFLWNVINPNEMQRYIEIYEAQPIAVDGTQMKGAYDE